MAFTRIILWIGYSILFCASLMGLTGLIGLAFREVYISGVFIFLSLMAAFFGGMLTFTTRNAPVREGSKDALFFLIFFWVITPILFAFPYWFSGVSNDFASAYFESISAFTTTGASALVAEELPRVFLVWRALLQFCGGVVAATFAVVILAALNLSGTGVHRSKLFTLRRGELFPRLLAIGRIIALVYFIIATVCFTLMCLTGVAPFDALCLSLSGVSTGGLSPQSGGLSNYIGRVSALVLALSCVFGACNVALIWDLIRLGTWQGVRSLGLNSEHRGFLVLMTIIIVFGFFFAGLSNVYPVFLEAMFMVSTAGFDYEVMGADLIPPSILIMITLIGGSALSTAGGLKIIRLLLLLSHSSTDIDRMSHPSRVKLVHFRGQVLPDRSFLSIWMYFFGYTLVFAAGILALGAAGLQYEVAVSAGAGAISNMGLLLPATFPNASYAQMSDIQLFILSILMIFGRVEVLAALAAFTPAFWMK